MSHGPGRWISRLPDRGRSRPTQGGRHETDRSHGSDGGFVGSSRRRNRGRSRAGWWWRLEGLPDHEVRVDQHRQQRADRDADARPSRSGFLRRSGAVACSVADARSVAPDDVRSGSYDACGSVGEREQGGLTVSSSRRWSVVRLRPAAARRPGQSRSVPSGFNCCRRNRRAVCNSRLTVRSLTSSTNAISSTEFPAK
jgi:hypothetical protein